MAAMFATIGMFTHPFLRHAFVAGTAIALVSGPVGYLLVLRSQVFTADALSHVAFTGAVAALALGVDSRIGLFVAVVAVALVLAWLGGDAPVDDVTIGSVFVWVLGLGVLFLSIFTSQRSGANGTGGVSALFGSIFGLDAARATMAAVIAAGAAVALVVIARPLVFATVDHAVAAARGVPVRALGLVFLVVVGVTAAEATQAVGALVLLGLLAAPAGAARQLTARPYRALGLAAALSVAGVWLGLSISYAVPRLPPTFVIMAALTAEFVLATAYRHARA